MRAVGDEVDVDIVVRSLEARVAGRHQVDVHVINLERPEGLRVDEAPGEAALATFIKTCFRSGVRTTLWAGPRPTSWRLTTRRATGSKAMTSTLVTSVPPTRSVRSP